MFSKDSTKNSTVDAEGAHGRRQSILQLASESGGIVLDFDDGHVPETCAAATTTNSCEEDYSITKLIQYPAFFDQRLPSVHVIREKAAPQALVDGLYHVTANDSRPWGTYVTTEQIHDFLKNPKNDVSSTHADTKGDAPAFVNKEPNQNDLEIQIEREKLAVAAAAHFFQNALQITTATQTSDSTSSKESENYMRTFLPGQPTNNDFKPQLWTQDDHDTKAHGVAIWALASCEEAQVPYHLDYAEQIRYEYNVIVPPLLAGTLQCTPTNMIGGDFCVCFGGIQHYEANGYKGMKTSLEYGSNKNQSEWVQVPYRYNQMILQSGHLPHLSTQVKELEPLVQDGTTQQAPKRVIVGFNVFGHDYGPLVQQAPEHSDVFRRKVALQRIVNQRAIHSENDSNNSNATNGQRLSLEVIHSNKGLSKLLVLAKREKIKRELAESQLKLDEAIDSILRDNDGMVVEKLMKLLGNKDGSTWPSPTDVQVHIYHRVMKVLSSPATKENSNESTGRRQLRLEHGVDASGSRTLVRPSDRVFLA